MRLTLQVWIYIKVEVPTCNDMLKYTILSFELTDDTAFMVSLY